MSREVLIGGPHKCAAVASPDPAAYHGAA
jgi:hypothetical protein